MSLPVKKIIVAWRLHATNILAEPYEVMYLWEIGRAKRDFPLYSNYIFIFLPILVRRVQE